MPRPTEGTAGSLGQRTLSPPDSSLDDLELESCIEELDNLGDLDGGGLARKPHFLDYDNKPPEELVEQHNRLNGGASPAADEEQLDAALHCDSHHAQNGRQATLGVATVAPSVLAKTPPHMNASYETPAALSILPTLSPSSKKPIAPPLGARGTWPLKDRNSPALRQQQHHSLNRELSEVGPKMECVYSLLSMLGSTNVLEMSSKFLELSRNEEKCSALRRSGCVPLLVHIIHNEPNEVARKNARHALVNVIRCNVDETSARRELKVLRLIDQLIDYTDVLKEQHGACGSQIEEGSPERQAGQDQERHPIQAIGTLAKISYDEEHRHAMCQFGALQTISSLIQLDHLVHGAAPEALKCIEMRRYASMVLTNLTFGQGNNKALLCSNRDFMQALVSQLGCTELLQVTASVLRNLSWRADGVTKQTLIEIGTVKILTESAMRCTVENTLKSILSALWNLSNHCTQNQANICEVEGALEFLIDMLTYDAPSKTMSIVENAGGILRNVSSHIAQCEHYRRVLREKNCLKILLDQLKSPSLTVVSNACGTLGNISSDNGEDQQFLRENGAIPMLRSLIYSKHNIISNGSRLALKNLQHRPPAEADHLARSADGPPKVAGKAAELAKDLPGLNVRKQRAMEEELGSAFYQQKVASDQREEDATSDEEQHAIPGTKGTAQVDTGEAHNGSVADGLVLESDQPINYSLPDDVHQQQSSSYDYQETDIDQLTDYSLRYGENQSDSDDEKGEAYGADPVNMLIPEDSVKCYYTEGTPQIISSATSMSDLRAASAPQPLSQPSSFKQGSALKSNPIPIGGSAMVGPDDLGCNTPDKPFNYCEEGTPDFSRDASLNIIDLSDEAKGIAGDRKGEPPASMNMLDGVPGQVVVGLPGGPAAKSVSFLNTAEETPLMFSRTSSMGSLSSAEPACIDDKSSIVSEFSRLASGVISPSELPDSPSQTIAHSPRRSLSESLTSASVCDPRDQSKDERMLHPLQEPFRDRGREDEDEEGEDAEEVEGEQRPPSCSLNSVRQHSTFADAVNKFNVEHTPAQFSCATSLSNLSIEEKEAGETAHATHGPSGASVQSEQHRSASPVLPNPAELDTANHECTVSDGDSDAGGDDELLASCISIGMNSVKARSSAKDAASVAPTYANLPVAKAEPPDMLSRNEMLRRYRTETTAARQLTGGTSSGDPRPLTIDANRKGGPDTDDSSNDSDNNDRLLEECILSGMPKPKSAIDLGKAVQAGGSALHQTLQRIGPIERESPFKMMRNPVHLQPLLANDELSPFHVEDSPCNFSTVSALSELTVASDMAAAQTPRGMERGNLDGMEECNGATAAGNHQLLSSPSVASDEDDHLLAEAIATGAIRKAEKAQQRRLTYMERTSPVQYAEFKRMTSSPGSTGTVNSDDEQALLQDAIERGMHKGKTSEQAVWQGMEGWVRSSAVHAAKLAESIPDSDRDDDDYQLLAECIQRGMHTVPKGGTQQGGLELANGMQGGLTIGARSVGAAMQTSNPKNVHTTPVILKDVGAAAVSAGVVNSASYQPQSTGTRALPTGATGQCPVSIGANTNTTSTPHRRLTITSSFIAAGSSSAGGPASCGRMTPEGGPAPEPEPATPSASGCDRDLPTSSRLGSGPRVFGDGSTGRRTDRALETKEADVEGQDEERVVAVAPTIDKHKDPEQMLKSVERFTRELVSQSGHGRSDAMQETVERPAEAQVMFQLGGQVSFPVFSLQVDDSDSLMEFVNLPNIEPPSMMNDEELFGTSFTAPAHLPRAQFLPQFSAVANMANISSIEPPTMMNESLGSLSSSKWADGYSAETAGSLPQLISSCNTPPSAVESDACVAPVLNDTHCIGEYPRTRSSQLTMQDVDPCPAHVNQAPLSKAVHSVPSSDAKKKTPLVATAKVPGLATKASSRERLQRTPLGALSKLPQQQQPRKSSVTTDADKPTPKKPAYVSPYGRASGLPLTVRSKCAPPSQVTRSQGVLSGGSKVATPPGGRAAKDAASAGGGSLELKEGSKRNLGSTGRVSSAVHSPVTPAAVKSPATCSNEPHKHQKGSSKRSPAAAVAGRVSSVVRQPTTGVKGLGGKESPKQPKVGSPKRNLAPPGVSASPETDTKLTLLTRQQTFVNEKPSMAALPHISSAPSSPAKARKAASVADGARVRADMLTRANTTLQRRVTGGSVTGISRIPPPSARLSAGASPMGARKEGTG